MFGGISPGELADQSTIEAELIAGHDKEPGMGWRTPAYQGFSSHLSKPDFPCLFGKSGFKREALKFLFIDEGDEAGQFSEGLRRYTEFTRQVPARTRLYTPLIVIFQRTFPTLADQHQFCWRQLQALHYNDTKDWPSNVPMDPEHSLWTFCFDGVQLFINMSCPGHVTLKSRNLGPRITFVINPRENFDLIANRNSRKGIRVRQTIRERVERYNAAPVPDVLGFFGSNTNLEWRQYQLTEEHSPPKAACPFRMRTRTKEVEPQ